MKLFTVIYRVERIVIYVVNICCFNFAVAQTTLVGAAYKMTKRETKLPVVIMRLINSVRTCITQAKQMTSRSDAARLRMMTLTREVRRRLTHSQIQTRVPPTAPRAICTYSTASRAVLSNTASATFDDVWLVDLSSVSLFSPCIIPRLRNDDSASSSSSSRRYNKPEYTPDQTIPPAYKPA